MTSAGFLQVGPVPAHLSAPLSGLTRAQAHFPAFNNQPFPSTQAPQSRTKLSGQEKSTSSMMPMAPFLEKRSLGLSGPCCLVGGPSSCSPQRLGSGIKLSKSLCLFYQANLGLGPHWTRWMRCQPNSPAPLQVKTFLAPCHTHLGVGTWDCQK